MISRPSFPNFDKESSVDPYVVSGDIKILWTKHCSQKGWHVPNEDVIDSNRLSLRRDLEAMFGQVDFLDDFLLRNELQDLLRNSNFPLVTFEGVYSLGVKHRIDICRSVNSFGDSELSLQERWGKGHLNHQLRMIPKTKVSIIDDVAFSGKSMKWMIMEFAKHQIPVQAVYVCVGTDQAREAISNYSLSDAGMPEKVGYFSCRQYSGVIDQVCERDFYPGMPYSGRQHGGHDGACFPYLLPWGRPTEWASIPEKGQRVFSQRRIQDAIDLYRATEEANGLRLTLGDLPRKFLASHGSTKLCNPGEHLIDYLHRMHKLV